MEGCLKPCLAYTDHLSCTLSLAGVLYSSLTDYVSSSHPYSHSLSLTHSLTLSLSLSLALFVSLLDFRRVLERSGLGQTCQTV